MNYEIKKITKDNFSEFGDFINPYDKIGENINSNTTKSYFDLGADFLIIGSSGLLGSRIVKVLRKNKVTLFTVARDNSNFNLNLN